MNGGLVNGEAFHQPPILITPRPFREGGQGGRVRKIKPLIQKLTPKFKFGVSHVRWFREKQTTAPIGNG
jgi:hypothetical protein